MGKQVMAKYLNVALIALWSYVIVFSLGQLYLSRITDPERDSSLAVVEMPYCQFEDGSDVDGYCLWVDPGTGHGYINPAPEEVAGLYEPDTGAYVGGFN